MTGRKGFLIAACGLFLMLGILVSGLPPLFEAPVSEEPVSNAQVLPAETPPQYLLKIHGDRLAVFDPEYPDTPIEVTEIDAATLRNYDREQLKVGLPVSGREELLMLLEDYGS